MQRVWSIVFAIAVALGWSSSAAAFEDKLALGAGATYAAWPGAPAAHGAGFDLQAGLGLSEAWQLRAGGAFAAHPHPAYALKTASLRAELVYLVDIVDLVPFAGLGVAGLAAIGEERTDFEPAVHVALGGAYWLSFDWLLELAARGYVLPTELSRDPLYFTVTLSLVLALDR